MVTETRVALAEVHLAVGDRAPAHDLLVAAGHWFPGAGSGEGTALVAALLADDPASPSTRRPEAVG